MSRFLAEGLAIGDTLEALEPSGRFKPTLGQGNGRRYLALAAGSGITPVLSIVATLLAEGEAQERARVVKILQAGAEGA